jgi:flagellar biosynthetic protein FliP
VLLLLLLLIAFPAFGQVNPYPPDQPSPIQKLAEPFETVNFLNLHNQLRIVALMTVLVLIPTVLIMMTSFTRLVIIFHFLRQALATQTVPSNQLVIGLSLILTGFVMHPVIEEIESKALTPYLNNQLKEEPEVRLGIKGEDTVFFERAWAPLRKYMLLHTREKDMELFLDMGHVTLPKIAPQDNGTGSAYDLSAIPWYCLVPAYVTTELRIAFMMGFLLFLPFLVIDMVVASVLMSMGMMMLPPVMISLPFKILLFIVVDGWRLIIQQSVKGFFPTV